MQHVEDVEVTLSAADPGYWSHQNAMLSIDGEGASDAIASAHAP